MVRRPIIKNLAHATLLVSLSVLGTASLPPSNALAETPAPVVDNRVSMSKLGIHLLSGYSQGAAEIIRSGPKVIKILGTTQPMLEAASDYKKAYPQGTVVLRVYTRTAFQRGADPVESARTFWEDVLEGPLADLTVGEKALIDYVEGPNECETYPAWETVDDATWFGRFWVALANHIGNAGFKPCVGSIPVGNPGGSPAEMDRKLEAFYPALQRALELGGAWSYHSYTADFSKDVGKENWFSLRYRMLYDMVYKRHKEIRRLPLILTEGGFDKGGNPSDDGWQANGDEERYKDWLRWYDKQIRLDPYLLGVTLFQIGDGYWSSFDVEPISGWLAEYLRDPKRK